MKHESLKIKINEYLPTNTHKLLETYLNHKKFDLQERDYKNVPQPIETDVHQGCILGLFLYLI